MLACELARLGDPVTARQLVTDLAPRLDGLAALWCAVGSALAGSDPDELLEIERRCADAGLSLFAAELAATSARAFRRRGDGRAAVAAQLRSTEHLAHCEGSSTPGTVVTDTVSPLSNREREITALAASGLSNQEIADRLYVSVRTVGNHLQNAYTKLGINGRADLPDALHR
jgi:DNA-binding NarL/FixJ family response regulator